jgi:hypothetical protein
LPADRAAFSDWLHLGDGVNELFSMFGDVAAKMELFTNDLLDVQAVGLSGRLEPQAVSALIANAALHAPMEPRHASKRATLSHGSRPSTARSTRKP